MKIYFPLAQRRQTDSFIFFYAIFKYASRQRRFSVFVCPRDLVQLGRYAQSSTFHKMASIRTEVFETTWIDNYMATRLYVNIIQLETNQITGSSNDFVFVSDF